MTETEPIRDEELVLSRGSQRAVVAPYGASLRRYAVIGAGGVETDVVWGYSGAANKKGGQGDVLIPFPGRVRHGRYSFGGRAYQMEQNDKEGPNAIHGFLRSVTWEHERAGDAAVRFRTAMRREEYEPRGYPFSLDVQIGYSLEDEGLVVDYSLRNVGDGPAPVGVGFHPYFVVGTDTVDGIEARIPVRRYLEFGDALMPTGRVLGVTGSPVDFRQPRRVGGTCFNHCFQGLDREADGIARVRLRNPESGREVVIWMDETLDYLVVYTGDAIPPPDGRAALAVEPMTCGTDAFNHPEWGLPVLEPGQVLAGRWGVTPSDR